MAASGYSPIQLYYSTTASTAPAAGNLVSGELAINITDGKLYYKDNAGVVQLLSTSTTANGTANGVLYLNGSKVATAVSTFTFDGSQLTLNGAYALSGDDFVYSYAGGTSGQRRAGFYLDGTNGQIRHYIGGSEAMRLTSTGLGIGTSSPGSKLAVIGSANLAYFYDGSSSDLQFQVVSSRTVVGTTTPSSLVFKTNNTERAFLDSSGNLGLGVTPSAWRSGAKAFQLGTTGYASLNEQANGSTSLNFNCYESAANTWTYFVTGVAPTRYTQLSGVHAWYNAASGTAGNAITFTQAMTLDSSGRLGVGSTSPSYRLEAYDSDSSGARTTPKNVAAISAYNPSTPYYGFGAGLVFQSSDYRSSTPRVQARIRNKITDNSIDTTGSGIAFDVTATEGAALSEAMFLGASGNLGLGVTPSAWGGSYKAIQVNSTGAYVSNGSNATGLGHNYYYDGTNNRYLTTGAANLFLMINNEHRWYNAASGTAGNAISFTQAMTLDASGRLSVVTTSPTNGGFNPTIAAKSLVDSIGGGIMVEGSGADATLNMGYDGTSMFISSSYRTTAGYKPIAFYTSGSERARIDSSGNLLVGATSAGDSKVVFSFPGTVVGLTLQDSVDNSNAYFQAFRNSGGTIIGSVTRVGTTSAVIYNTTSDYRLKNVIGEITGSGARIDALEPVEYEWKENGKRTRGFLAHKFQEVYPQSVSGEKDAVDADGKPVYQAMQASTSEVIADLVAEIKSLRKRLADAGIA